jgi:hypothetical protein
MAAPWAFPNESASAGKPLASSNSTPETGAFYISLGILVTRRCDGTYRLVFKGLAFALIGRISSE